MVPIFARAGQAGHLHPEHDPDVPQPDLSDQALKASPACCTGCRLAEVVVNDQHALGGPAQIGGAQREPILQARGLLMFKHRVGRGLAHVDDRQALIVPGLKRLRGDAPRQRRSSRGMRRDRSVRGAVMAVLQVLYSGADQLALQQLAEQPE